MLILLKLSFVLNIYLSCIFTYVRQNKTRTIALHDLTSRNMHRFSGGKEVNTATAENQIDLPYNTAISPPGAHSYEDENEVNMPKR